MVNPVQSFKESSSETKQFVITVLILFVIVMGTFFYAYGRLDQDRTGKQIEEAV